jgi:hypothetical protein
MLTIFGAIALTLIALSLLSEWERRQHRRARARQARIDMMRRQAASKHDPNRVAWSIKAQAASRWYRGGYEEN